ncbi:hypothetical protein NL676_003341 [Syzygium grande]|nr:hypothetical protein NL676_003341 [Syzygium grande]
MTMFLHEDQHSGNINFTDMLFGCGHANRGGGRSPGPVGMAGVNRYTVSLAGQIGLRKFSYCASSNRNAGMAHGVPMNIPNWVFNTGEDGTGIHC